MTIRHLDSLFRPAAVAVIGASRDDLLPGAVVLRRLRAGGFAGPILAVNRHAATVQDQPAYGDVDSLPVVPDLAVLATAPREIAGVVEALCRRGCRGFVVLPRRGDAPRVTAAAMGAALAAARPWLGRVLGPDCFGLMVPSLALNATLAADLPRAGHLACITRSGAMAATLLGRARATGTGISKLVGAGMAADIDLPDLLDYLALDAQTHVIGLHVETVANGRKFMSALRAAARMKPVIVCRAGLAGDADRWTDAVYDAVLRRAGALRVRDADELFDAATALSGPNPPRGGRLAIAANGAGLAAIAADAAVTVGLQPQGPALDIGNHAPPRRYAEALAGLTARNGGDAVLLAHAPAGLIPAADIVAAVAGLPAAGGYWRAASLPDANIAECEALSAAGFAVYADPAHAVRGLALALRHRQMQERAQRAPDHVAETGGGSAALVTDDDGLSLLAAYGINALPPGVAVGLRTDPVFGPMAWLVPAAGADRVFGLPPLDPVLAADMSRDAVAEGMVEILLALGRIAIDHPEIRDLSVETTGVGGRLRSRIALQAPSAAVRLAIRPFPRDLAGKALLRNGMSVDLRPVRPDDAPMVDDLFEHLTPDDVHTRFFSTLRTLPRALRARLTQIDYDREMALVATTDNGGAQCLVGMVHLLADPDFETAEFAVMVRSDWQGRGVGHALMQAILAYARSRGLKRMLGVVLNENGRMLGLARSLGCTAVHGQDPGTTEVRLDL